MGEKNDSLIAYNILEKRIINAGLCTLCGACEAACPVGALHIEDEKVKHTCGALNIDLCTICYNLPHSEALCSSLSVWLTLRIKNEALWIP
jgi:Fe-S-cluster-containing hydrogenase component 2